MIIRVYVILFKREVMFMEIKDLNNEQLLKLKDIKNPTITKVIKLSDELNIDMKILAKYFIDKTINEIEEENNK